MRSKKAMLAALVVSAGAVVGIGQVTNTFPVVETACSCPTPTFPPQNTVAPVVSGNTQVGQGVIAATDGTWTHSPTSFTYSWETSPNGSGSWSALGDTDNVYILVTGDVGNYIRISVTGTNAQGSAIATSNVLGPISAAGGGGGPSTTLANVWVSSNGNDAGAHCVRSSVASADADTGGTSDCKTFSKAYQLANCGDNVLLNIAHSNNFADQVFSPTVSKTCADTSGCRLAQTWQDGTTTNTDLASCVTFQPGSGGTCIVGNRSIGSGSGFSIEVPYVRIIGCSTPPETAPTSTTTYGIRIGANTGRANPGAAGCTFWNVHDVIFQGVDDSNKATTATVTVTGGHYIYVRYVSFGPLYAALNKTSASFVNACKNADVPSGVKNGNQGDHYVWDHNIWHDYHQVGSGVHMECIHYQSSNFVNITNNAFENCGQQPLSIQTQGGAQAGCTPACVNSIQNAIIMNNTFDQPCSNPDVGDSCTANGTIADVAIICDSGTINDVDMWFNSFDMSSGLSMQNNVPASCTYAPNGVDFLGNVIPTCGVNTSSIVSTNEYNITKAGSCTGTGNVTGASASSFYNSPSFPNYDYTPKTGSGSIDLVPLASGCPTTDRDDNVRPDVAATNCDAGALETATGS